MRKIDVILAAPAATLCLLLSLGAPSPLLAQQPGRGQQQAPKQDQQPPASAQAAPKPYKAVPITLPQPLKDSSFESFRKQLAGIAEKKDRAALAKLVAQSFFWMPEDKDIADKKKPGIDRLSKAIGLDGEGAPGWDALAVYALEATAEPDPQHNGVVCAPADPSFDQKAAEELATSTQTDASEWAYPVANGVEVRSAAQASAPVVEKLGLHFVRVYPDESVSEGAQDMMRIVTPSGKIGFVAIDSILPLVTDQVCYVKEGDAWKIAGVMGGVADQP